MKKSIFLFFAAILCAMTANAYNQSAVDLYFDNSEAKWNSCYVYIGHSTWTSCYPLTRVSGTQYLWKLAKADFNGGSSWNGATGWVLCYEKWWDSNGESIDKYIWHGDNNVTKKSTSAWVDTKIYKTNGAANATSDGTTKKVYTVTSYDKSDYTVTINTVEGGTLTVKDYDNNAVASGDSKIHLTVLKFSATPASGYVLDAVEINDGANTTTIATADLATKTYTLTSAVTINPVWRATTSTVTVTATATNGSVTGGGVVEEGTSVTLTATPDAGYQFVNWTVGGAEVSTANPYTFTAEEDVTVVANFEEIPTHDITVKAFYPASWNAGKAAVHFWGDGVTGATPAAMTKDGDWWSYTVTGVPTTTELSVIFINGDNWNGDANQTVDITGITESTCYQVTAGSGKASAAVVDCASTPVVVYTVVGSSAPLFGETWATGKVENDMTLVEGTKYELVKTDVSLTVGEILYKVAVNHAWDEAYPGENAILNISEAGKYTVTFTFDSNTKAVNATADLTEAAVVLPIVGVKGAWDGWATTTTLTGDNTSAAAIVNITTADVYEFGLDVDGNFQASGATIDKANNSTVVTNNAGNMKLTANVLGEYTFTWTYETNTLTVTYPAGEEVEIAKKYYIAGSENLTGYNWKENGLQLTKDGDLYKHTFSALPAGVFEFKVTNGTWTNPWGYSNLGAAYEEVSEGVDGEGNPNGNIKFVTEEAKNITVIFDPAAGKITIGGLTEKAPAEPVTIYFINSGEWAEVACYYWGGLDAASWPGVQMTATGETYEAEGWNVYAITFPGDNTKCIFTDNKAEGTTQTGDLEVQNGKYYCYANGIWYERLADVDPLDTRVYLKGDMNEWCATEGWCDMFRKEDVNENVAYRTTWLEAETTYEFKIEDAGTWLSNEGTMDKDNCTGWEFTEGGNNAKITTEYAGDYTFVWDMTTKTLSVEYPNPMANPEVMDLMVTDMVFDGSGTFSGTDNMMGIVFTLVVGDDLGDGVYSLDASSTVNFGGTLFTDVTGMIAPDTETFASATAQVFGFYMGMYFQLNVEMSAGGSAGVPVEILNGTASVNGAGELWITGQWEGDDVYVQAPGFPGESFECDEVWFYVGGTDWETASIIAFGPATITVDGNDVLVEGTVMSGMTGTNYDLFVIGTLPAAAPNYTRTTTPGNFGTICLPYGAANYTGMELYECVGSETGKVYLGSVTTLAAGVPYIFKATDTELAVYSDGTTAAAGSHKGLHGTFTDDTEVAVGNYILKDNAICEVAATCWVNAYRAYIVWGELPTGVPTQMPGRRYIGMSVQGENEATGFENITAPEGQAIKAIVNGQLIIIRNGEKFNAQGVRF